MNRGVFFAAAMAAAAYAGSAAAAPGLSTKVYEPYVKNGVTEVELRAGALTGGPADGEGKAIFEVSHGFSDRVSLGLEAHMEKAAGGSAKLEALSLAAVVYLGQIPGTGVDVAGYVEYEQPLHGGASVAEGKLLFARQFGPIKTTANLIAERPISLNGRETEFEYGLQATAEAARGLNLGVQALGDLGTTHRFGGRQEHYLGPLAQFEMRPKGLGGEIELEAAYLFAAGSAKDETGGQFRFVIEFEKRF